MKSIRIAIGLSLILGGMALGLYVTLHYFGQGIMFIKAGQLRHGLILLLVWSELLGIATTLALLVPGVLMLKNLQRGQHHVPQPPGEDALTEAQPH